MQSEKSMNGTELITFLSNNFPAVINAVGAVTGSLFTAIFLGSVQPKC